MNRFGIQRPLSKKKCFLILSLLPLYFIVAGLFMQPVDEILQGIVQIIREPDFLITDYFVIGGVGAAFVNAGVLTLICIGIMYALDMNFDGHTVTSTCLMFGFSLFGKNLLNIWMILVGVFLYAKYHKTTVKRYLYVGFYGTSLSPIVSQVMHIVDLPLPLRLLLCAATGIIIGFVLPPLSTHVHYSHKGYSLYNVGFAGGIIATVIVSILKSFGVTIESRLIWFTGQNQTFIILLSILFGVMILYGIITDPMALEDYRSILRSYGLGGTDYYKSEGGAAVMINMGVNGLVTMLFVVMVGGDLNGPTIGGIFTVVGFSATGKHLRNILPVMAGVLIASEAKSWNITDPSAILALLLSTTLAPIAGEFGIIAGVIAGFLHSSVALNVGIVYGGMNLYNNGFAGGLVAMFLVPVIQSIRDRRARARGGLSL
ncbi:DUF1576 domain-containing protein [Ventrimonas sp. CLA-AP-H27]|uniref:DUF1576 domain-containing protein n=1 Tax=Ventrimonas faecis TaxID=3133170 RepID=A0ABV1HJ41_9FIRM